LSPRVAAATIETHEPGQKAKRYNRAVTAATALRVSAICQLVLALYSEAIQWFRLGAWNNQPKFEPL